MTEPFWETSYKDLNIPTFGQASQEVREVASELAHGAKILDLGCGEGRNALLLAERGFDVTAVDVSESGIRKLNALARQREVAIHSEVADMRDYQLPHSFDLIISHGCLHLVERKSWQQLIPVLKAHTNPGGINIVVVFTDAIPPPDDLKDLCLGLFREGEVFSLYSDWEALLEQSYTFEDEHPGSSRHTHPANKLVARKPLDKEGTGNT